MYEIRFFVDNVQILDALPTISLETAKELKLLWDEVIDGKIHVAMIYLNGELI